MTSRENDQLFVDARSKESLFSTRKNILNILPELRHNEFIYKLVCKDSTRVPIALYLKTNWLHRLGYGIYEAANYK